MILSKEVVRPINVSYVGPPSHPLQTLDIWVQNSSPDAPWLIYIHGGGWRDPRITKSSGYPLIHQELLSNPSLNAATINYRLSPHPDHPEGDNHAIHPDHSNDVLTSLLYLKASYGLSAQRYILSGNSAGATIIFQVLNRLGDHSLFPSAIVSASGVYDLVGLIEEFPQYASLIEGAFGEDREVWKSASPTWIIRQPGAYAGYEGNIILIQSDDDDLMPSWKQTHEFLAATDTLKRKPLVVATVGRHDDVPSGKDMANAVELLLADLIPGKKSSG